MQALSLQTNRRKLFVCLINNAAPETPPSLPYTYTPPTLSLNNNNL
ncbi:hypothetical protein HCH_03529 [Hahella chejuensis KCTC 2396]|uniref:Uncharacterized protein n=1 Tax=Hahella chejuensis (strain KCTC 2396) TaxID=349521 RepID=Q2SGF1_HAHCH|nr:hypothetical protein HCH_03529 [Hahella chejuensis KCTC 2396]